MKHLQAIVFMVFIFPYAAVSADSGRCGELPIQPLPDVQIVSAEVLDEPVQQCKVSGVVDQTIRFELHLPAQWNGKFVFGGGGGFVGTIDNQAMRYQVLERGYATVGTDTGHQGLGIDGSWALHDMRALVNYGHWAVHRVTSVSKALIRQHYGTAASRNYFVGCSNGGRQAMMSAQRYPDDFDGIVAMAPSMNFTRIGAHFAQIQALMYPDPQQLAEPVLRPESLRLVAQSVLAACDAHDGLEDGLLGDPRQCDFDVNSLATCPAGPEENCLTAAEHQVLALIYGGPKVQGRTYFPGFPFGDEDVPGNWDLWLTGSASMPLLEQQGAPSLTYAFANDSMRYLVYHDPEWDYSDHDWSNYPADSALLAATANATSTDLSGLNASGGKLLLWHGWSDAALTAFDSINYFEAVEQQDPEVRDYLRLFLSPGVLHCWGGPGASVWNPVDEIDRWVDGGKAPQRIETFFTAEDGSTDGSRPICSYPQQAVYTGSGSTRDASNFECR